jgi:Family of unknown function (DUF6900)
MQDYKDKLVRDFRSTDEFDRLSEAYMRVINPNMINENEQIINNIAKNVLGLQTLQKRNSDEKDFHDLPVWKIKEALMKAYEEGKKSK